MTQSINDIHKLDCHLAPDDFGTGYSSLSHLLNVPIHTVKIDKTIFPRNENTDDIQEQKKQRLFKGLVNMLAELWYRIVVEGVETQYQATLCQDSNVDYLQGYYLSRPEISEHSTARLKLQRKTKLTY